MKKFLFGSKTKKEYNVATSLPNRSFLPPVSIAIDRLAVVADYGLPFVLSSAAGYALTGDPMTTAMLTVPLGLIGIGASRFCAQVILRDIPSLFGRFCLWYIGDNVLQQRLTYLLDLERIRLLNDYEAEKRALYAEVKEEIARQVTETREPERTEEIEIPVEIDNDFEAAKKILIEFIYDLYTVNGDGEFECVKPSGVLRKGIIVPWADRSELPVPIKQKISEIVNKTEPPLMYFDKQETRLWKLNLEMYPTANDGIGEIRQALATCAES